VVTGLTAGTATVKYTITTGCGNSATKALTVNAIPATPAAIGGTKSVCVGSTTSLSETSPSGVWSSSAPAVARVSNTGVVTGVSAGTTTVAYTVTNGNGCSSKVSAVITVNPLASQPGSFTVYSSVVKVGTANVVYTVPYVAGVTYKWSYSGKGASISGTTNSVKISFSLTATSGTLSVTASNGCGTSFARTLAIILNNNDTKSDTLVVINAPVDPVALDLNNALKVYPNPSTGPAIFEFTLGESTGAKLEIYTLNGQHIARIFDGAVEAGIPQTVLFEQYLPTDLYPCVLSWNGQMITIKFAVRH
jgi:hypothetical protein